MIHAGVRKLSVRRQCELLCVNRSRLYYKPVGEKPENLKMMQIMDKHLTDHPTEGVKSLVLFFIARNYPVGPQAHQAAAEVDGTQNHLSKKKPDQTRIKNVY